MEKQKQIEEMAAIMADCDTTCDECFERYEAVMTMPISDRANHCQAYMFAQKAFEAGYRKIPEGSVVLDQEEWATMHNDYAKAMYNARYQTAREIFVELFYIASIHHGDNANILAWAKDKAKRFGVEVE